MSKFLTIVFGLMLAISFNSTKAEISNPVITTTLGDIKGSILTSVGGKPIYSFRGIRYAKPPVDELRFQPPVPVEKWSDVYDATKDGPLCPQPDRGPISEDCLFVNVYTTKLPKDEENLKRPVMVFIHYGSWVFFTGSSAWVGPEYLLDEDIVLVTMNYRLGALGFLNTEDELAPGSNGMKDQVMAMRWVKEHISPFGGDPDSITLAGASVGAGSVTLHLVSPMSKGLFIRAIIMSGSTYGNWPIQANFTRAQKQARLVGCPDDTSANIINCLKTKTAKELAESLSGFQEFLNHPLLVWYPVIEPDFGQERFLLDDPKKLVQCGQFTKVPVLTGISSEEFEYLAYDFKTNATLLKEFEENFETIAPISFLYERNSDRSKFISKELRKFYLGEGPLTDASVDQIGKLYADSTIGFSVNRVANLMAEKNTEPVYYYQFSYRGPYSNFYKPGTQTPTGVAHLDDLIYLFYTSALFSKFNETDPEYAVMKKMTSMWANFARTGKPISTSTCELDNVNWEPYTVADKKYLDIGKTLIMKENLYGDRYALWDKLLPLPKCET